MDFFSFLQLLMGLSFFLFGMRVMSGNLEKMAGGKLEQLLKKMTANPLVSLLLGAAITIAVQSSSATTVMLVGLVNSGIMQFGQTLCVIFGANIGTTFTGWVLSLSSINTDNFFVAMIKPENFSPILAFIGILMVMISKKQQRQSIGTIFVGFAVLMYGMDIMSDAVAPLAEMPQFSELMGKFTNPVLSLLVALAFTALIQSSAASIGILLALCQTGSITYGMAIAAIMGLNIGTCATALISSIGTTAPARRVATVHVTIKILGAAICLPVFELLNFFFHFDFVSQPITPFAIALIHTIYNLVITLLLMPFSKALTALTIRLVPEKKVAAAEKKQAFSLDERLLRSPSVAIGECDNQTVIMSELAKDTVLASMSILYDYDPQTAQWVKEQEEKIDLYEDNLGTWLVKLSQEALSNADGQKISKMLHVIGNFERLSDHAVNLLKVSQELHDKHITFTGDAYTELQVLTDATIEIILMTTKAYAASDVELSFRVEPLEQVIDGLIEQIRNNHVTRLRRGQCTIELGFVLSDLLTNYERISDHCSNIAVAIIETLHDSFDTHQYLKGVKYGNSDFNEIFDEFEKKYSLPTPSKNSTDPGVVQASADA